MEPSFIYYWKHGKFQKAHGVFTSEEQVAEWYTRNRWRVEGLSVVVPVKAKGQQTLTAC